MILFSKDLFTIFSMCLDLKNYGMLMGWYTLNNNDEKFGEFVWVLFCGFHELRTTFQKIYVSISFLLLGSTKQVKL